MEKVNWVVDFEKRRCTAYVGKRVFARYSSIPDFVTEQQDGWEDKRGHDRRNRVK